MFGGMELFFLAVAVVMLLIVVVVARAIARTTRGIVTVVSSVEGAMSSQVQNGIPSVATIESVTEGGATTTSSWTGPDSAAMGLTLIVNRFGGGQPYQVAVLQSVPRVARPMIVPGAAVPVLVDPLNPMHVQVDWNTLANVPPAGYAATAAPPIPGQSLAPNAPAGGGGFSMTWDAGGRPTGDVNAVASGVHAGTVNTIQGSADQLLASGTHGVAVITTAQPLGKTVRDMNPNAKPERLDYPMWLFTVEVTIPGEAPFPAIFGHYVPTYRVALVAPGAKLAVSVNEADRYNDVAIDWDHSPLPPGA